MILNKMNPHMNAIHIWLFFKLCYGRPSIVDFSSSSLREDFLATSVPSQYLSTRSILANPNVSFHAISNTTVVTILRTLNIKFSIIGSSYYIGVVSEVLADTMASRHEILVDVFYLDLF